jgi:hypothetical protein
MISMHDQTLEKLFFSMLIIHMDCCQPEGPYVRAERRRDSFAVYMACLGMARKSFHAKQPKTSTVIATVSRKTETRLPVHLNSANSRRGKDLRA